MGYSSRCLLGMVIAWTYSSNRGKVVEKNNKGRINGCNRQSHTDGRVIQ
jgi:hypothetical protein